MKRGESDGRVASSETTAFKRQRVIRRFVRRRPPRLTKNVSLACHKSGGARLVNICGLWLFTTVDIRHCANLNVMQLLTRALTRVPFIVTWHI